MYRAKDLTGEQFGDLTVVAKDGKNEKRGEILWKCGCSCGKFKTTTTSLLKSGKHHSCGCKNKKTGPPRNDKDVVGKKFNSFLILEYAGKDKWRQILYKYRCDCGNEGIIPRCRIGKIKKCPECRYGGYEEITQAYWTRIQIGAKSRESDNRKIDFNLKIEDIWNLFLEQDRKCALTGVDLHFPKTRSGRDQNASLDRIDSLKGYTVDNVQWVHKKVNELKWSLSTDELYHWCDLIMKFKEVKNGK